MPDAGANAAWLSERRHSVTPKRSACAVTTENSLTPLNCYEKSFWREIGVLWPHKSAKGYDLIIHEGLSVSGRIVCTEPKDKDAME
jgi:hypothetical protein